MIYVLNSAGSVANILEPEKDQAYWNDQHLQDLKTGVETYKFDSEVDIPINSTIVLKTTRNELIPFIVQKVNKVSNLNRFATYECDAEFLELRYSKILDPITLEGQTPETSLAFGLQGTRWQVGYIDKTIVRTIQVDKHMNILKYLRLIASEFEMELRFRVEFKNSRVSKRYVDFVERTGLNAGKEIVFGKDLKNIERLEDSSVIVSALYGIGPADSSGQYMTIASVNGGKPYIEDQEALERWGKDGEHRYDIYTPSVDSQNLTAQQLYNLTYNELQKRINSVVQYKVDAVDFYEVFLMQHEEVNLGDTVRIKDEGFNPALYLEARAIRIERSYTDPSRNQYLLGDYREIDIKTYKYIRDLQNVLNKNKEGWNSAKETATANSKTITLINQDIDSIELSVSNLTTTTEGHSSSISQIELDVDGITSTVSKHETTLSDPSTGLVGRMSSAESSITQNASAITSKVSTSDYNGNTVMSMINQTSTTIKMLAENIELDGITHVANTLTIGDGYGTVASIRFNQYDSWIRTYGAGLAIESFGNVLFDLSNADVEFGVNTTVDLGSAKSIIWGSNAPTNVSYASNSGNADTLDGYHASSFSLSGHTHSGYASSTHTHSDYEYVKPSSGQNIRLGVYETGKRLNIYLGSTFVGYIPYT